MFLCSYVHYHNCFDTQDKSHSKYYSRSLSLNHNHHYHHHNHYKPIAKFPTSCLHLVLCLPCLLLRFLGCHSVTLIVHLSSFRYMLNFAHLHFFSFSFSQDVFNFDLLPNPWSLPISTCYTKYYSLHYSSGTLKCSFYDFRKTYVSLTHILELVECTDYIPFSSVIMRDYFHNIVLGLPKALHPVPILFFIYFSWTGLVLL